MSLLGIDVGTTTCKGIVIAKDGSTLARYRIDYSGCVMQGLKAEMPAIVFWENTANIIATLSEQVDAVDPIEALSISTHGETLITVDAENVPVGNAILSMDRRCINEARELEKEMGSDLIYQITGSMMHSQYPVAKIMWIQRHNPDLAARIRRYYSTSDYIYSMLGFEGVVDYSIASRFGMFDINKCNWSDEILKIAKVCKSKLSTPVVAGTQLGIIPQSIAKALKLRKNVNLFLGGHDQPCAAIGMGGSETEISISAGSYECASLMTDKPLNDKHGMFYGLNSYCHVVPEKYITLAFFTSGLMIQWYLDNFCSHEWQVARKQGNSIYDIMDGMVGKEPTGICVTPHIYGSMNPEWSEAATTIMTGVTATTTKAVLYRAVLEGICCELDLNIKVLEKLSKPVDRLRMSGGGTRSEKLMQLRADITGKSIHVLSDDIEASCVGAAILAGVGIGAFVDLNDARRKIQCAIKCYEPLYADAFLEQKNRFRLLHKKNLFS